MTMSNQMNVLKSDKRGFTLVELLVVVTILAILLALTIPNYLRTRPQRLLGAQANKIAQMIRYGRLQAIRDNKKYYLEFIPELDLYRLWGPEGWNAYADPLRLNGDLDGDGDNFTDGEDTNLTDGIVDDPDILLSPIYPPNLPKHTVAPALRFDVDTDGNLTDITRDFDNANFVGDQAIFPFDVDIRLQPLSWDPGNTDILTRPTWTDQVNILSRAPLLFLTFFPDGSVDSSWSYDQVNPGLNDEIRDLEGGTLGVTEIFLQMRGEYNAASDDLFPLPLGGNRDGTTQDYVSHWDSLDYPRAIEENFGRRVIVNHVTGRIKVDNIPPIKLDFNNLGNEIVYF